VTPLPRRDLLVGTLYGLLLAVFPWLRRKKRPQAYLYKLATLYIGGERIAGVRQEAAIGSDLTAQERFERDFPRGTAWRFGDGDVQWRIYDTFDPNTEGFVRARRKMEST